MFCVVLYFVLCCFFWLFLLWVFHLECNLIVFFMMFFLCSVCVFKCFSNRMMIGQKKAEKNFPKEKKTSFFVHDNGIFFLSTFYFMVYNFFSEFWLIGWTFFMIDWLKKINKLLPIFFPVFSGSFFLYYHYWFSSFWSLYCFFLVTFFYLFIYIFFCCCCCCCCCHCQNSLWKWDVMIRFSVCLSLSVFVCFFCDFIQYFFLSIS